MRRILGGAVALGLTMSTAALVSPAAAAPAAPAPGVKIAPGSEIVSAGTTGFLSVDPKNTLRWTRYADGVTTEVGQDSAQHTQSITHGSASDVVAIGDNTTITASHKITLRDMATGSSTLFDLDKGGYSYVGAVGPWVIVVKYLKGHDEAHVLGVVNGELTDRKVEGMPDNVRNFAAVAGTPGSALVRFAGMPESSPYQSNEYAVIDLAAAKVTDTRGLRTDDWAGAALSPTHMASLGSFQTGDDSVSVSTAQRGPERKPWSMDLRGVYSQMVGLVGNWVLYGNEETAYSGSDEWRSAFRAVTIGGSIERKVLDHASSVAPTPEGDLLAMGGSVDQGEGLYRVSAGADGAPVTKLVASTGEPTKITLVGSDLPAAAQLDRGNWRARWQLSRVNARVVITLRHTATGNERTFELFPEDKKPGPGWVEIDWDGLISTGTSTVSAPNGDYTWKITAKPDNGVGPDLNANGTFSVRRAAAAHDYTDNGSPDLLVRGEGGVMLNKDTYHDPQKKPELQVDYGTYVGPGWNIYDRIVAVGDVAGAPAGDVVATDRDGVMWLYLGKGDGTFADRLRLGAGWNGFDEITGGSDLNGDGHGDLLARETATGVLWLYPGTGNWRTPFGPRQKIAAGWNIYDRITAVGDVAGAPAGDVVARDRDGVLWLYLGIGNGKLDNRVKISAGWGEYRQLVGIGDANRDGRADLIATTPGGTSYIYHGTGDWRAPFATRQQAGVDIPSYDTLV
ncbi:hypothetical protein A6A06_08570 [Streptomyces sp. CB02923]|nr:hypothetical protein A6A06_08570 [Streptomyces sp. CB02923]